MKRILVIISVLFFLGGLAWGQEETSGLLAYEEQERYDSLLKMSMEDLMNIQVVTASKNAEKIDEAPNVMYVITKEQIRARGYRSLKDALVTIPGFNVFHRDLQFVGQVRGIAPNGNEKITFMLNGHIINQVTETEILDGPVSLDNIERIEVIIGPGSVMYGPETLTSIVNMITSKGAQNELTLSAGNYRKYAGSLKMGKQWADDKYINVSLSGMTKDGWNAFDSLNYGDEHVGKRYPSYNIMASGQWEQWHMQFFSYNSVMPELAFIKNMDGLADAGKRYDYLDQFVVRNQHDLSHKLEGTFDFNYTNKRMLRVQTKTDYGKNSDSYDLYQKVYKTNYYLKLKQGKHLLQGGAQVFYYQNRHNYVFNINPGMGATDTTDFINTMVDDEEHFNFGLFLSEKYQFNDQLSLTGAFRLDRNTLIDKDKIYFSPRVALIYSPYDAWVTKLMFNRSLRMPAPWMSPINTYWNRDNSTISTGLRDYLVNDLANEPEQLSAYEWQNIFYFNDIRISLNVYYQELKDFIIWYRPFTNVGDYNGAGGELDVKALVSDHLSLWGNASYTNANFNLTANKIEKTLAINESGRMLAVPKITANAGADMQWKNLSFSPTIRYFTGQRAKRCSDCQALSIDNRYYFDAALNYDRLFTENLNLSLIARNILDNTEEVSAQAFLNTYHPRGFNAELVLRYHFR